MLAPGDGEAIRQAALRALREDLAEAECQAFYLINAPDRITDLRRQIAYVEKMVFVQLGENGLLGCRR